MKDHAARARVAEVVRRLIHQAEMPASGWRAVFAMDESPGLLRGDVKIHVLSGAWQLQDEVRSKMVRCVMDLFSGLLIGRKERVSSCRLVLAPLGGL